MLVMTLIHAYVVRAGLFSFLNTYLLYGGIPNRYTPSLLVIDGVVIVYAYSIPIVVVV